MCATQECHQQTPMLCPQILDEIHFCIVKFFFSLDTIGWMVFVISTDSSQKHGFLDAL